MFRRCFLTLLAGCSVLLSSCATSGSGGSSKSRCCLLEPGHGALLMPETASSRAALERWVNQNAHHLSINGGAKPRFILLYVSKEMAIKDQMPVTDQSGPTAPHKLTAADVAALRACFTGGQRVKVDWATKSVRPL